VPAPYKATGILFDLTIALCNIYDKTFRDIRCNPSASIVVKIGNDFGSMKFGYIIRNIKYKNPVNVYLLRTENNSS
jgi:hypothetical protein